MCEPPGPEALPRGEALGLGQRGTPCGAGVPHPPIGNFTSPEPLRDPALNWAGIRRTSCQGWAVGGALPHAPCQNHWKRACSVFWVCLGVFLFSEKLEGIGTPAS